MARGVHVGILDGLGIGPVADVLTEAAPLDLDPVREVGVVELVLAGELVGPGLGLGLGVPLDAQRRQIVVFAVRHERLVDVILLRTEAAGRGECQEGHHHADCFTCAHYLPLA